MTTETTARPTRAVLEDRYEGLLHGRKEPWDASQLQDRLDEVLADLIVGVIRVPWAQYIEDNPSEGIIDDIEAMIRATILDRMAEVAR